MTLRARTHALGQVLGIAPLWLPLALAVLLGSVPVLRLGWEALSGVGFSADAPLVALARASITWRALGNSLYVSLLGTMLAMALGALFAVALTITDLSRKGLWAFAFMLPMMIPPQVTALAWLQLSGPASPLLVTLGIAPALGSPQPLHGAHGIALLLGVQHAPLVFLALRASLVTLPGELVEAARLAGAAPRRVLIDLVLPLAAPGLIAGGAIAFVSALGNFGIPAMLGIPVGYYVLPTLIYQKLSALGPMMLPEVAQLSMLVAVVALASLALQRRLHRRFAHFSCAGGGARLPLGRWRWPLSLLLAAVIASVLVVPGLALVMASLLPAQGMAFGADTVTLSAYAEMLGRQGVTWRAMSNSLLLASIAAAILMALSLPLAWLLVRRPSRPLALFEAAIEIPYALPGVVLAVGCILAFARPLPLLGFGLYGSLWIILIAYLARFMVVALKPVQASLAASDPALEEAAQLAGAGPLRRLVELWLPLLAPAAFAGALLVFLTAVNELTVSALLWGPGSETLGVLIFNLDQSGDNALACALSVIVMALVAGLMLVFGGLGRRLPQGVIPWRD
ncbi:ABC transporter permease [Halotalea alkalilenta]|uniref:ABC transporter permease n=1 Tax=Halotalea alkalilenta TaxID=376489 RepID=A0A172YC12_9GAMM|nr:iron ABC transporter permease [Halotalea alkalilenta]ANF56545.1 ABC transporter permease [Halotalea alkalilenta]